MSSENTNDEIYKDLMGTLPPLPPKLATVEPDTTAISHPKPTRDLKVQSVNKIIKIWRSYSMKKTFQYLKESLHKAVMPFLLGAVIAAIIE
jgi:hypothetical protein